jgi:predicted N-formylglutamate amidohydrolase
MRAKIPNVAAGLPRTGPVDVVNPAGRGGFVLVCEHAGNFIPPELHDLGLGPGLTTSHIAWDPGALPVAREMSRILDAPLVAQRMSRLMYDCNRPPESESAIPEISEIHPVPGNAGLTPEARRARVDAIYVPFRDTLAACIDGCVAAGEAPVIVTVHSFTPVYKGVRRELDIGILHDTDTRVADAVLRLAGADADVVVRRNQPYGPEDGVTHTLRTQALPRGLGNVMIEVRNDLIRDGVSQRAMAGRLSRWLLAAQAELAAGSVPSRQSPRVG